MGDVSEKAVLQTMQQAFRTTVSGGGKYEMVFRFPSMEAMHIADDEWHNLTRAPSGVDGEAVAVTDEQINDWLTTNCGMGLPHGEVTDMTGALHALAYVHRQIASTTKYKVHIGQCVSAESGLLWILHHLAKQALATPPVSPKAQSDEVGRLREALADFVAVYRRMGQGAAPFVDAYVKAVRALSPENTRLDAALTPTDEDDGEIGL